MTIVLAKHDNSPKEYVFAVPANMRIFKGDLLLVNTNRGTDVAIATTNMIEGEGAEDVAKRFGAYEPIKTVREVCGKKLRDYIRQQNINHIVEIIKAERDAIYLPF